MTVLGPTGDVVDFDDLVREDRVHRTIYTNDDIYDLEMERIYERTWVYVGHESEVANPGDYKTATLGRQPIIISRSEDGTIHVLFNRCRHRGSLVCKGLTGSAQFFRCPFHGWVYKNSGELVGVPLPQRYPEEFDKADFGLVPVPRVESYHGLVFASLNETVQDLGSYLGEARSFLDRYFLNFGVELSGGCNRQRFPANWKLQIDGGPDGYHAAHLHETFFAIQKASPDRLHLGVQGRESPSYCISFQNGHSVLVRDSDESDADAFCTTYPDYAATISQKHGEGAIRDFLSQVNLMIFPNLYLAFDNLRVITPMSTTETQVAAYPMMLSDAPARLNEELLRKHEEGFTPAGFISPDDFEAFVMVQAGLRAAAVPWVLISRGLGREEKQPDGTLRGVSSDEVPQRGMYRYYRSLMTVGR